MAIEDKNKFGQYFTPKAIADFMVQLLDLDKTQKVLEPSCGDGVFLNALDDAGFKNTEGIEIDASCSKSSKFQIKYADYLQYETSEASFDGVIGNPPYIRWKNLDPKLKKNLENSAVWNKYCNSLSDYSVAFIAKAILDLKNNGTLVFITPEYWLYTFHAQKLRNLIVESGTIDRIFYLEEASIFENVNASLIIFRFKKSITTKTTIWKIKNSKSFDPHQLTDILKSGHNENFLKIDALPFKKNERFSLEPEHIAVELNALEKSCVVEKNDLFQNEFVKIGDVCDIGNGMVTGLDKAFQILDMEINSYEKENLVQVAKAKQLDGLITKATTPYLFLKEKLNETEFSKKCPNFYLHLQKWKGDLLKRYSYGKDISYWEWVFLRNRNLFNQNKKKIFVPCKERIGFKNNFRFTLALPSVLPTQDVTGIVPKDNVEESIEYIHMYLISKFVTDWIVNRGVMRGGVAEFSEAPIASIPFRKINWMLESEVAIHNNIVNLSSLYYAGEDSAVEKINNEFKKLLI